MGRRTITASARRKPGSVWCGRPHVCVSREIKELHGTGTGLSHEDSVSYVPEEVWICPDQEGAGFHGREPHPDRVSETCGGGGRIGWGRTGRRVGFFGGWAALRGRPEKALISSTSGPGKGNCIDFAKLCLGGRRGLGIEKKREPAERLRDSGYECIHGDVTSLELPRDAVRFVTMSHVLEHLPDLHAVRNAVEAGATVASDFLFIQGPWFDSD